MAGEAQSGSEVNRQQPPIEHRALLLKPAEFDNALIWRRQKYAKLAKATKPVEQREKAQLEHEIQVLGERAKILRKDATSPNPESVREQLAALDAQMKTLNPKDPHLRIHQAGIQIRRQVLEARAAVLQSGAPIIRTMDVKRWKAKEQFGGPALPPSQWEQLSPRLQNNPDAILSENEEYNWYLSTLSPERRKEIRSLREQMRPINDAVRAVVCMPAHKEGGNIYRTLENYVGQQEKDGKPFDYRKVRIVVFDNWPEGSNHDQTGTEVQRFMKDHPEVPIDYVKGIFDPKILKIANIRNMITAAIIDNASLNRKGGKADLIYVSNDADIPKNGIKPTYVADIISEFDTHPHMDALAGKIDFPEELMDRVPVQLATRRLWQYIDSTQRHLRNHEPFLVGRNSAQRLKLVAAVGNYDPRDGAGEDVEIGNKIKWVRSWDRAKGAFDRARSKGGAHESGNRVRYVNKISLDSDPRRDFIRILGGERIQDQYSVFERDQSVRGKSGEELARLAVARGFGDFDRSLFEKEAGAFYWETAQWAKWGGTEAFNRAMRLAGAEYTITKEGKFQLTNTERLEQGVQEHRFRYEYKQYVEKYLGTEIKDVRALRIGNNNQVYVFETAKGRKLVLRMAKPDRRAKFISEQKVMDLARKNLVPTPKVIGVNTDCTIIPGWTFSLSERLPGNPVASKENQGQRVPDLLVYQAGRVLRKINAIPTKGYGMLNEKLEGYYDSWEDYVLRQFDKAPLQPFIDKGLLSQRDIDAAIAFINENKNLLTNAPRQLLHGDFSLGNMLVSDGKIAGMLDFENASSGDPLWDIAYFRNYTADSTIGTNGISVLLNGYGQPDLLSNPAAWKKYNMYRLANAFVALRWQAGRKQPTREGVQWLNTQLKDVLATIKQPPPSAIRYIPTAASAETKETNREIASIHPISQTEVNTLLKNRFDSAVKWFKDFYEKGQAASDQEYATGRKRYQEIAGEINTALKRGDQVSKDRLFAAMKADTNVSLSDKELRRQIDRLIAGYKKSPELFNQPDVQNPAFRFLVYARNRGRLARYERSYGNLPAEIKFNQIVSEMARKKAASGQSIRILDEGGTFDLGIQQLAERMVDQNPSAKVQLSSTSADDLAIRFKDCHRFPVTHKMADVHQLTETFRGQKQDLIVSEAAYKFFWDPLKAITETANLLENGGWAFLGDIQESVSYDFDKLFVDENGKKLDPVAVFNQLNKMGLGYKFYVGMHRTDSMGDHRRVLTLAIKKETGKDLALPLFYGKRDRSPQESAWMSPLAYILPRKKSEFAKRGYVSMESAVVNVPTPESPRVVVYKESKKGADYTENHDTIFVNQGKAAAGVFDGSGNSPLATQAAKVAAEVTAPLLANIDTIDPFHPEKVVKIVEQALIQANTEVMRRVPGGHTTASVVKVLALKAFGVTAIKRALVYGHIGDSRIWIRKKDGSLQYITQDHGHLHKMWKQGALTEQQYQSIQRELDAKEKKSDMSPAAQAAFEDRAPIYRFLGEKNGSAVDAGVVGVEPGDIVFLTSDGIHDVLTSDRIKTIIDTTPKGPVELTQALMSAAEKFASRPDLIDRAKKDDMSVAVLVVK